MPVYIAMLRGINVSGQKLVKMEKLRTMCASLGFSGVKTYIQSGNVVFTAAKSPTTALSKRISERIFSDFGFEVPVMIRSTDELGMILKNNPLHQTGPDETGLHVVFLSAAAPENAEEMLRPLAAKSEKFAVAGQEIYLYCPAGYGETKLSNAAIEKKLSVQATTRNWKTANVLHAMALAGK